MMDALTLRHPWPYTITHLGKRIENRIWQPHRKLIGQYMAIHGGVAPTGGRRLAEACDDLDRLKARGLAPADLDVIDTFTPGVVAIAKLTGFVEDSDDPWFAGPFGWLLADVFVLPAAIPIEGKQGLWALQDKIVEVIRVEWKAAREHASR